MDLFPLEHFGNQPALIDGDSGTALSYLDLKRESEKIYALLPTKKSLVFLFCQNRLEELVAYVGLIQAGAAVCLLEAGMPSSFKEPLIERYEPDFIIESSPFAPKNYAAIESPYPTLTFLKREAETAALHPDLQLLLTTSGTTGNPKLIRLSRQNLVSNARSIIDYLAITSNERAIASLPIHYSYGLSVLHSHLLAGASVVLTQSSPAQGPFWEILNQTGCTSLAGVPFTYHLMDKIGFERLPLPTLKTLTQAGGALEPELIIKFHNVMQKRGGLFYVMYGQTEATARIAYLPPALLPEKAGAIGRAIPGGKLRLVEEELVYEGPNVMMGYAENRDDLMKGDELNGVLYTGDLGRVDADGLFF